MGGVDIKAFKCKDATRPYVKRNIEYISCKSNLTLLKKLDSGLAFYLSFTNNFAP